MAFNEGAAYRFETAFQDTNIKVVTETADFNFSDNYCVVLDNKNNTIPVVADGINAG